MNKLLTELSLAVERSLYAAIGSFASVNIATISTSQEWKTIGIATGLAAAASMVNSLRTILGNTVAKPSSTTNQT